MGATTHRLVLAIRVALLTGAWTAHIRLSYPTVASDLEIVLLRARAWLAGLDPYATVAVGPPDARILLMCPFTAVVLFAPFAHLPTLLVNVLWTSAGAGCLAWALTSEELFPPSLAMFISAPLIFAIPASQWTPQLAAAALLPWGGWLFACKPTTALWLFAYRPTWRHVITASIAIAISLALWPTWPFAWPTSFGITVVAPVALPGGAFMLLALLRWRRPEARLLATMVLVPHSPIVYKTLPLFLIPGTWMEARRFVAAAHDQRFRTGRVFDVAWRRRCQHCAQCPQAATFISTSAMWQCRCSMSGQRTSQVPARCATPTTTQER